MNKDKYIVFKADEVNDAAPPPVSFPDELEDCVVIRLQDRFAAAGLHGYASCIQSVIEAANECGVLLPASLQDVRDYFFEMAEAAEKYPTKKWPD